MTAPRYKNRSFQQTYEGMLTAARDPSSELYYNGKPHRGAGHRTAFWDGYAGVERSANVIPGTPSAVCYAAGKEFARTNPGIPIEDAVWTPGYTRQGEAGPRPKQVAAEVATIVRKLGDAQTSVLRMMNPEWVSSRKKPDSRALSILRSLEKRALVYENFGRWTLTQQGRLVKDSLPN